MPGPQKGKYISNFVRSQKISAYKFFCYCSLDEQTPNGVCFYFPFCYERISPLTVPRTASGYPFGFSSFIPNNFSYLLPVLLKLPGPQKGKYISKFVCYTKNDVHSRRFFIFIKTIKFPFRRICVNIFPYFLIILFTSYNMVMKRGLKYSLRFVFRLIAHSRC